ncbi:MAG: hypothetical protein M1820_009407 [Bogoriella megaspora]|nr:MAG: hypothetical protein M1820_009407 [Bogoriella megaspora]
MPARKVLIVGATGSVGSSLTRQLLAIDNPLLIRGSTRNVAKATFPPQVEAVQGDLEDPTSYSSLFNGIDCVFTYAGEKTPWPELLAAAKAGGVRRIVLLSSMTAEFDPDGNIGTLHRQAEEAIEAAGFEYTFIRPRNFASNTRSFWAPTLAKTGKLWITYPNAHTAPVSEDDMAAVALVGITTDRIVNQAVPLCGPVSLSQQEQFEAINRLREREGKAAFELVVLPPDEWRKQMQAWRGDDFDPVFVDQLLKWWKETDGTPEKIQSSERITGQPSQSYDDWLELNKDAFLKN